MMADIDSDTTTLNINIDIVFHRLPCHITGIDVKDIMGSHSSSYDESLSYIKVDKLRNEIGEYKKKLNENISIDDVISSLDKQEGCRVYGKVKVLRVPGALYFSSFSFLSILYEIQSKGKLIPDVSHTINHISFGDESDNANIRNSFNVGLLNPLDGATKNTLSSKEMDEYYLKVVPTTFYDIDGQIYETHQFISNSHIKPIGTQTPAVYIRFDISPIMVKYTKQKERIHYFLVQICAIVGGIYTVTTMILSLILNSYNSFIKNKEK